MTQFAFENLMPPGLTGEASASNACGGHVRPEVKGPQAGPVKQEFFSVRKNPLDSSRGEVNPQRPDRAVRAFFVREAEAAWDKQKSCPSQEAGRAAFVVGECSMAERSRHTERMGVTSCHPCRPCRPCRRHRQQAFRRRHHPPLRTRGQRRPIRWSAACRPRTRRSPAQSA